MITNFSAAKAYRTLEHDIRNANMLKQRDRVVLQIETGTYFANLRMTLVDPHAPALSGQQIAGEEAADPAADNLDKAQHESLFPHFQINAEDPIVMAAPCLSQALERPPYCDMLHQPRAIRPRTFHASETGDRTSEPAKSSRRARSCAILAASDKGAAAHISRRRFSQQRFAARFHKIPQGVSAG